MKKLSIIIFFITFICGSCSLIESTEQTSRRQLRKAKRLKHRAYVMSPQLFKIDTVWSETKVYIPGDSIDTVFVLRTRFDTIKNEYVRIDSFTSYKDRIKLKVVVKDSLVFVDAECPPIDTVVATPTQINEDIDARRKTPLFMWAIWTAIASLLIVILVRLVR